MPKNMEYKPLILIAVIYISIQLIGIGLGYGFIERIESGGIPPVVKEPENPLSSLTIFFYMLFGTGILLFILKFKLDLLIKILSFLFLIMGLSLTLWIPFGFIGLFLAVILFSLSIVKSRNPAVMNIVLIFTIPGVGALFGSSLAFIPSLILILLLSAYDLVAVFGTKHMITLAEGSRGKIPLMFEIPFGDRFLGIGTGDLTIPLIFSVSVLRDYSFMNAVITATGGLIGILILFIYILNRKKCALPALPPICAGLITGFLVALIIQ